MARFVLKRIVDCVACVHICSLPWQVWKRAARGPSRDPWSLRERSRCVRVTFVAQCTGGGLRSHSSSLLHRRQASPARRAGWR